MSTTDGDEYELIEVPVQRKIEIRLGLDDLLNAVAEQAGAITTGASEAPPQVADRLRQLREIAQDIRAQLPGGSA